MKTLVATAALAFGAAAAATPASAIVSYTFSGPIGNFTYYSPNFLAGNLSIDQVSLAQCSSSVINCETIGLYPDSTGVGFGTDVADALTWTYNGGNGASYFYFDNNSFQSVGVYKDTFGGGQGLNTLTVAQAQQPTPGTVTYNLHNAVFDATFQTHAYVTGSVDIPAAQLLQCVSTIVTCSDVTFHGDPSAADSPNTLSDSVVVGYDGGNGHSFYYFGKGTLQVPGQYLDNYGGDTVLTVTAVPEPTAWAMLITGFGLSGAMARRRRIAVTPTQI